MIVPLTSQHFDSNFNLQIPGNVIVLLHRPGCPHCTDYHPK